MLKKGSVINGVVAPLWTAGTSNTSGIGVAGTSFRYEFAPFFVGVYYTVRFVFSDPDGLLELSSEQKGAGVLWRRPREAFAANPKIFSPDLRPEEIVQRIVADCSLCASIIVCLLHSRTHDSEVCSPARISR